MLPRDTDTTDSDWRQLVAADVMTRDVRTVPLDWSVDRLSRFLTDNTISGAPVVDEAGRLTGVVTLTDIVRQTGSGLLDLVQRNDSFYLGLLDRELSDEERRTFHEAVDGNILVSDIMTPVVYSVGPETPMTEMVDAMVRGHIHRVLVTEKRLVVGIVTVLDMLSAITRYEHLSPG